VELAQQLDDGTYRTLVSLADDGQGADVTAGDRVYSGTYTPDGTETAGVWFVRAVSRHPDGTVDVSARSEWVWVNRDDGFLTRIDQVSTAIKAVYDQTRSSSGRAAAQIAARNALSDTTGVQSARYANDRRQLFGVFDSGIRFTVTLEPVATSPVMATSQRNGSRIPPTTNPLTDHDRLERVTLAQTVDKRRFRWAQNTQFIEDHRAMGVNFRPQWTPIGVNPDGEIVQLVDEFSNRTCPEYTYDLFETSPDPNNLGNQVSTEVALGFVKDMVNYPIVFFASHGEPFVEIEGLLPNMNFLVKGTNRVLYQALLNSGTAERWMMQLPDPASPLEVAEGYLGYLAHAGAIAVGPNPITGGATYSAWLTGTFFDLEIGELKKNTTVFLGACHPAATSDVMRILVAKGAAAVLGHDRVVNNNFVVPRTVAFVKCMLQGKSLAGQNDGTGLSPLHPRTVQTCYQAATNIQWITQRANRHQSTVVHGCRNPSSHRTLSGWTIIIAIVLRVV
jgi:hypothetical protein